MLVTVETVGVLSLLGIHVFAQLFCGSKTVIFNLSSSLSLSLLFFFAVPHVMWDLSTLLRDLLVPQSGLEPMPLHRKHRVLIIGPSGKFQNSVF